ncbi:MAG: hypothetical protein LBP50_09515 [Tannerella sp.]|jgi:hypothetical protein|nr:hypothetical protein [Tannerella sp.]
MTYREWITGTVARFNAGASEVDLILAGQQRLIPDPDAEVDVTKAKTALCRELSVLIPLAGISEGGYSISWNLEAVRFWYGVTCAELGLTPAGHPKVRDKSFVW